MNNKLHMESVTINVRGRERKKMRRMTFVLCLKRKRYKIQLEEEGKEKVNHGSSLDHYG